MVDGKTISIGLWDTAGKIVEILIRIRSSIFQIRDGDGKRKRIGIEIGEHLLRFNSEILPCELLIITWIIILKQIDIFIHSNLTILILIYSILSLFYSTLFYSIPLHLLLSYLLRFQAKKIMIDYGLYPILQPMYF